MGWDGQPTAERKVFKPRGFIIKYRGRSPEGESMANPNIKEQLKEAIKKAKDEVVKTKTPQAVELMANEFYTLQILVTPPGARQYGAVTVERDAPGILLQIRSSRLWRNALTIPTADHLNALLDLVKKFTEDEELMGAVKEVIAPSAGVETRRVFKIG